MDYSKWTAALTESASELIDRVVGYLPNVLSAIALVVIGWLLARLLHAVASRLTVTSLERLARNPTIHRGLERTGLRTTAPKVISSIAYWVLFLFFLAAAIEKLDLPVVTTLLSTFAGYLPDVLLGILVVFVGILGGNVAHHAISRAASSAGLNYADFLGRTVQVTIVLVSIVIAADQVGIQSTFLMLTIAIVVGTTLGGAALAFGLGSGPTVSNILASYYLAKTYRIGQTVKIGGVQGTIVEMTPTAVVLEAADARVTVPARKFTDETSMLLTGE